MKIQTAEQGKLKKSQVQQQTITSNVPTTQQQWNYTRNSANHKLLTFGSCNSY
jgi:hypothetical protein